MAISSEILFHQYLVKNSCEYRRKHGRHYVENHKEYKGYHYNKVLYLYDPIKFVYEIDSNLCLYKELYIDNKIHILRVREIGGFNRFPHSYFVQDAKLMKFDFRVIVDHEIIDEEQNYTKAIGFSKTIHFEKFICSNKNIFTTAEKLFDEIVNEFKNKDENFDKCTIRLFNILNIKGEI